MNKILDYGKFLKKLNESLDSDLVGKIDYTLLSPSATETQILELCEKATKLGVKSVCVLPKMVRVAAEALKDSPVLVCTVVSFPHGTDDTDDKVIEANRAINEGADEVDMVLNYPKLKELVKNLNTEDEEQDSESALDEMAEDVEPLVTECHKHTNKDGDKVTLKVIVESGLLSEKETHEATYVCLRAGADFIKTSTGFASNKKGAELNKVQIMRKIIDQDGSDMKIKASGGIRTMNDLQNFAPYVDRFGVGFAAVDSIFSGQEKTEDIY